MATRTLPRHAAPPATGHELPPAVRATVLVVGLTLVLAVVALAFALPAAKSAPRDVPIGVTQQQAALVSTQLDKTAPGAFAVTAYPDADALRAAIRDREVYGGLALGPGGPTLLIATGAGPAVAQLLSQVGNGVAQHAGMTLRTEDLAPPTPGDPRGVGLAASALPITLAGLLPAVALVTVLGNARWTGFAAVSAFAVLAALTITALLRYTLGAIDQNFWGVAVGLWLGIAAMALPMLGLGYWFGKVGLAAGGILAMLLGNPLSGLASAPEMLPAGWGALGQWLPQGANATLLRSTAFFDGAGGGAAVAVLTCWAVTGAILAVSGASKAAHSQPA